MNIYDLAELLDVSVKEPETTPRTYARISLHLSEKRIEGTKGYIFVSRVAKDYFRLQYNLYNNYCSSIPFTYEKVQNLLWILEYIGLHISGHKKMELIRKETEDEQCIELGN